MGIQDLQSFIESGAVPGSCVPVDLVKIGRNIALRAQKKQKYSPLHQSVYHRNQLTLVVDGECCLDRLYGGFYSDWACGGQWGHMITFLSQFLDMAHQNNVEMAVFLDGSSDEINKNEWIKKQLQDRQKINAILKHIATKGTPPPKIWWIPPVGLRSVLRMALRTLHVCVGVSMENHKLEILHYLNENGVTAVVADDAEYAVFQPVRYFSAKQLKLRFKGNIESKEYIVAELLKGLELPRERVCVVAALLGNAWISSQELSDIYTNKMGLVADKNGTIPSHELVRGIAKFVKNLTEQDNLDAVVEEILGSQQDPRAAALKQSIVYYYNGTKGLAAFKQVRRVHNKKSKENKKDKASVKSSQKTKDESKEKSELEECSSELANEPDLDTSQLATEAIPNELDSLAKYKEVANCLSSSGPEILEPVVAPVSELNETSDPSATSAPHSNKSNTKKKARVSDPPVLPTIPTEVIRTVAEQHSKGAMSPLIYQIYMQGEIRLPVLLENEDELPNIQLLYRPIRQKVYAILFNLHHHTFMSMKNKSEKKPDVRIKEWVWSKSNEYARSDWVRAEPLKWGVPTVQRLWFGTTVDDRRRRLRAFLTCMRSDTDLMLYTEYVPQHLLLMACVLRYIMTFTEKRILRRPELDAFIVTAVSPEVMNAEHLQDLQLPLVTARGVQLSTLFMAGIETALLVNDACGAPIPWMMNCPWLFFDGKLFNYFLAKAAQSKNVEELCEHRISIVVKVEKMRQAILEGIDYQFARPPGSFVPHHQFLASNMVRAGLLPLPPSPPGTRGGLGRGSASNSFYNGGRNNLARRTPAAATTSSMGGAGGKLEVAGVVVGSWGPNYNFSSMPSARDNRPHFVNPHMSSVGGFNSHNAQYRSNRASYNSAVRRRPPPGFQPPLRRRVPFMATTKAKLNHSKPKPSKPVGRGMTVVNPNTGETKLAADIINETKNLLASNETPNSAMNGTSEEQFENTTIVNGGVKP